MADRPTARSRPRPVERWFPDAPASDWALRLTIARIADHDGHGSFLVRWLLWAGLVVMYGFAHAPWWAWLCLIPGAIQGPFEIATKLARDSGRPIRNPVLRWASQTVDTSSGRFLMNGTGAVGLAAVPLQVFATAWLVPAGEPTWARPVGLALALMYLNSAISGPMNDTPYYNPRNTKGLWRLGRFARRYAGVGLSIVVLAVCLPAPWPGVPWQVMALLMALPVAITLRTRHSDTVIRASADTVAEECTAARQRFHDGLHGQLTGPVKSISRLIQDHDPPVSPALRELGLVVPLMVSGTSEMIDEQEWIARSGRASMRESVQARSARNQIRTTYLDDAEALDATNKHLALLVLANLVPNAAQAQRRARPEGHRGPTDPISVRVHTTSDGMVEVSVGDDAPPVGDEFWCAPGTNLELLRDRLRHLGGDLVQHTTEHDHKVIIARWRHTSGGNP
ncbi:MAG TPA: hypothetical protein IAA98_01435 [Candidatus Avipropionibacterium avicola]|uniref:Histidine kinase n=1 Tax=Candidatus Avipropionibacterium avicola TaxID=2840701 RepID=A0A9D1GWC1_9ACTN|nr:hypothetical protein [Candidatus Avipropionibacterium avicola]